MTELVQTTGVPFEKVAENNRLDASYYGQEGIKARVLIDKLQDNGIEIETVESLTERIFRPSIHTREYTDESNGEPYLTPTNIFMFPLEPQKYITNYPDGLKTEPGWLLITCSGTVGRINIANDYLSDCVLSQNLIRAIPNNGMRGYLYAYLNSWMGQAFLTQNRYGATIKHINPEHVAEIPVPIFPDLIDQLNDQVQELGDNRNKAERIQREVNERFYTDLDLRRIEELEPDYLTDDHSSTPDIYTTTASKLNSRLDPPYHQPIIQKLVEELSNSTYSSEKLGNVIQRMFVPSRFKRPYVDEEAEGIPFLTSTHLVQIKPLGIKHLWENMEGIEDVLLEEGWILMSRSGTVGRIRIADEYVEDWAANEHVLRLIPEPDIHPGYIAAFLRSPYGQHQIEGKVYGAVVDEIAESDTSLIEDIDIILPPDDLQEEIGEMVFESYERIGKANEIENHVVTQIEKRAEK